MNGTNRFVRHGGALDAARKAYPAAPEPWIDLSTGVNPIAYPVGEISPQAWERLPEESALNRLEAAAARRYAAPASVSVVAAPGTQTLLQLLPAVCQGRDVRLLGRTYGEFQNVFRHVDRVVRVVPNMPALAGADVAIVVNPNNPDGRTVPVQDLVALAGRVGSLVVDEAFVDALPLSQSVVPRLPTHRTIVLRSFGKIFGLAGLRLGFAVLGVDSAEMLRQQLGPWPVSGPALAIGAKALADDAWLSSTSARLIGDVARLTFLLRQIGSTPIGGTPLFRLISHPAAPLLFTRLAEAGILVRPFEGEQSWLRFGLPGPEAAWLRLEAALTSFR